MLNWLMWVGSRSRICPSARSRSPSLSRSTEVVSHVPPELRLRVVEELVGNAIGVERERAVPAVHHEVAGHVVATAALDPQIDVAIAVYVAGRRRLGMEVSRPRVVGMRPQRVLAPDGVGQRVRRAEPAVPITQEQLRRIAVLASVSIHSDALIEDREIGSPVAVEVIGDHDCGAHVDRSFDQLRRVSEPTIPYAGEHAQRGLRESVFGRRAAVVIGAPSRENIVAAIAVEVCNGMYEFEPSEIGLGDDARKGDPRRRLCCGCGTAEQRCTEGCHEELRQHGYYSCVPARPRPPVVALVAEAVSKKLAAGAAGGSTTRVKSACLSPPRHLAPGSASSPAPGVPRQGLTRSVVRWPLRRRTPSQLCANRAHPRPDVRTAS